MKFYDDNSFELKTQFGSYKCKLNAYEYDISCVPGGGLYIGAVYYDEEFEDWLPFCDISTNLPDGTYLAPPSSHAIYLRNDESWYNDIKSLFADTKLAYPTGNKAFSGYCTFEEWVVDIEMLKSIVMKYDFSIV